MTDNSPYTHTIRVADLPNRKETRFTLMPDSQELQAIARDLALIDLRKLRFEASLAPMAKSDWRLTGTLGATVVQPCVVTLAPVTTRIDVPVERYFYAEMPDDSDSEEELDDTAEELRDVIDLGQIMIEALVLALPVYPRAPGAELDSGQFAPPGVTPLTDESVRPFAGLAGLRDKLKNSD